MRHSTLFKLMAAPAVAGLLFAVGCEEETADNTIDSGTDTPTVGTGTDRDTTAGTGDTGTDDSRTAGAEMGGAGEVSDQQIQQVTQRIDSLRDQAEQSTDPTAQQITERLGTLRTAVENRDWQGVAQSVTQLRTMEMPENLQQGFNQLVDQLKQLNIPALQNLPGMDDLPTVPGMPSPGGTGGATGGSTPPGGGA